MGSVPTKRKPQPIFDMSQFQQIQANQCNYRSAYGVYTSYENRISKQQVDKYQLQFKQKKQQQNYYECFLHRFRQEYIVNTIQFIDFSHRQFCSSSFRAQVFIQHIPIRLGDITDIPYPDNIYILKNSLLGFQLLYSMIGYFQVQEDLICINNYGEVKVWLNSDLSKNYPDDYNEQLKSQCDMVQRILHLIESNTNIEQCPIQLGEYFIKKHKKYPNFTEALQLINLYTVQHKTAIPKFCQSVFQVFQESDQSKLKKQLALYEHSQSSYHQKSERRNTIQVNDILIPLLELPHIQQQKNLMQWPKKSKTMRDTVKILPSYTSDHQKKYSKQFKSLFFQNTQRLPTSVNRTLGYHTPQNQFLNYYNQLRTKRSPMILNSTYQVKTNPINNALNNDPYNLIHSMKQSMASSFLHVSQSKKYSNWPNVNFTYKSPSAISNMGHCTEFDLHQNKELSKKTNQQWMKSKNSSKEDKFVNKTIKQKVKKQEADQIENKNFLYLHMTNINQIKKTDLNNYEEKLQLVYYDTGKGSELIDPEIAADLLKYL